MSKPKTHEINAGESRALLMRHHFGATKLSRFSERAPDIYEQLLETVKESDVDPEDNASNAGWQSLELTGATVEQMEALNEFCGDMIVGLEGEWVDYEGDPLVWKSVEEGRRAEIVDMYVPNVTKLTVLIYAILIKQGVDPSELTVDVESEDTDG